MAYSEAQHNKLYLINHSCTSSVSLSEGKEMYSREGAILAKPRNFRCRLEEVGIIVSLLFAPALTKRYHKPEENG
jgi:hypothetical protein